MDWQINFIFVEIEVCVSFFISVKFSWDGKFFVLIMNIFLFCITGKNFYCNFFRFHESKYNDVLITKCFLILLNYIFIVQKLIVFINAKMIPINYSDWMIVDDRFSVISRGK